VLHCPYCHGHEARDQPLGAIGTTPDAARHAQIVRQWSDEVAFLAGAEMDDGRVIPREALFVPPRVVPSNDLLVTLGADLDENGWVRTDAGGTTRVPGLWVAGNLANPRAQVISAAGGGSAAAIAMNAVLVADDVARAVQDLHRGATVCAA
jgi:thioredoxin reductase